MQRQRPTRPPHVAIDYRRGATRRRRRTRGNDKDRFPAIVGKRVSRERVGDTGAVGEPAGAAERIAGDPLRQPAIFDVAAVGIGGQPFADRKRVAARMTNGKAAVRTAHRKTSSVIADEHVRRRHVEHP